MCRIKSRLKIGSRESKNTKNYTDSLFLKSYIQSFCQLAKKFTPEHQVQAIHKHLHPTRISLCTLQRTKLHSVEPYYTPINVNPIQFVDKPLTITCIMKNWNSNCTFTSKQKMKSIAETYLTVQNSANNFNTNEEL